MQIFRNCQQKELASRQEGNWADFMPIISPENFSPNFKADLGLLDLRNNGPKIGAEKGPVMLMSTRLWNNLPLRVNKSFAWKDYANNYLSLVLEKWDFQTSPSKLEEGSL